MDYQTIAITSLSVVMGLLSFLGLRVWNDVQTTKEQVQLIKEKWVTKDEFNASNKANREERDSKHLENTGNFRRLEDKIEKADQRHSTSAVAIEKRLGDILVEVAKSRPQRQDGPERRRY